MAQFSTEPYAEANAKYNALQDEMKIAGKRYILALDKSGATVMRPWNDPKEKGAVTK